LSNALTRALACPPSATYSAFRAAEPHAGLFEVQWQFCPPCFMSYPLQTSKIDANERGAHHHISNTKPCFDPQQEPVVPVAVVAIGGNSLIKDEAHPSVASEIEALR